MPTYTMKDLNDRINRISHASIREFTFAVVHSVPAETWFAPASRKHHLKDERGDWGNLIHAVRVFDLCWVLANVFSLEDDDRDVLSSAAIIHDVCRHGILAKATASLLNHPALVRQLVKELTLDCYRMGEILEAVELHMGRWSTSPINWELGSSPVDIPMLLHIADAIVAQWAEVVQQEK